MLSPCLAWADLGPATAKNMSLLPMHFTHIPLTCNAYMHLCATSVYWHVHVHAHGLLPSGTGLKNLKAESGWGWDGPGMAVICLGGWGGWACTWYVCLSVAASLSYSGP